MLTPLVYWAQRHEEVYLRVELIDAQVSKRVWQKRGWNRHCLQEIPLDKDKIRRNGITKANKLLRGLFKLLKHLLFVCFFLQNIDIRVHEKVLQFRGNLYSVIIWGKEI